MKSFYLKYKWLIWGFLLEIIIILALSAFFIEYKLSALEESLDDKIEQQISTLNNLATVTGKGGFNDEAEALISDCRNDERTKFEKLLSSLGSDLSVTGLNELNSLFSSCGHVFANRRSSMQSQMERELDFLKILIEERKLVDKYYKEDSVNLNEWQKLIEVEKNINNDFQKMVVVQKNIINSLISGKKTNSAEVQNSLKEAQEVKGRLSTLTEEAAEIRSMIISS